MGKKNHSQGRLVHQRHALHERLQNTFFSVSSIKMKAPLVLLQGLRVRLAPLLRKVVTCVRVPYRVHVYLLLLHDDKKNKFSLDFTGIDE